MFEFRKISTKLGLIYAVLFVTIMMAISVFTYSAVTDRAKQIVGDEIRSSAQVFEALFINKSKDIFSDASLQVRDYGFRSAIASDDAPTTVSALETLRQRLEVDGLTFVDADGEYVSHAGARLPVEVLEEHIVAASYEDVRFEPGVIFSNNTAFIAGFVPVKAPDLYGWVLFGDAIGREGLSELEALSSIPLTAKIETSNEENIESGEVISVAGHIVLRQEIPSLLPYTTTVLRLSYPLSIALKPYNALLATLVIVSLFGAVLVSVASWILADRFTQPIGALVKATERLRKGEMAKVVSNTKDELDDLARAFNHMSDEVRSREAEIRRRSRLDTETMLPNRLAIEEALSDAKLDEHNLTIIALGVQRFAKIRGAVGVEVASKLMQQIYSKLERYTGISNLAVVSSGLLAVTMELEDARDNLDQLSDLKTFMDDTFDVEGNSIDVLFTVGMGVLDTEQVGHSVKSAMIAYDQAQVLNKDLAIYDHVQYCTTSNNLSLMGDLLKALNAGHVQVAFQPKVDLRSLETIGVEALVRWHDPIRGKIFPDQFIPLAEETGHIEELTHYVLDQSINAQKALQQNGFDLAMSVNVSGRLVSNTTFIERAKQQVQNAVGEVCFEITETAVIEDHDRSMAALNLLNDAGIKISIDDYGAGLSSLAYLKSIPASELKIDKEFVLKVDESQRDALLVRSTVDLAHSLGMKVTAEGVENDRVVSILASIGCDVGQGYGLGRPMFLEDLTKFLTSADGVERQANLAG